MKSRFTEISKGKESERPLTKGEVDLARSVFGNSIDYTQVSISPNKFSIFTGDGVTVTPNNTIYAGRNYVDDFSKLNQSHFIHEMSHIWQ